MKRAAFCPPIARLLGCRPRGVAARRARVVDAILAETCRMLDRGPIGPDVEQARERAGALLWTLGVPIHEPDVELLAWLVAEGLDVGEEVEPLWLPEPPRRVAATRPSIAADKSAGRRGDGRDIEGERTRPRFRVHGQLASKAR